jgi:AraC family transcriptional regulator
MSAASQLGPVGEAPCTPGIGDLAASVLWLLQTASREVGRDRDAAKICIARASSLLQVEAKRRVAPDQDLATGGLAPWQVHRVTAFVEERLHDTIRVGDLSDQVRLSATHFSRAFRRSMGETPHAYVIGRRLKRARHLMLTSNMGLGELALACGFTDQAHLCKLFRQASGKSPAAWRREGRQAVQAP